ncbi:MAG: dTDP-glucose 4,6-dehydratase [Candidatus Kapabacteria bacterium]|nr:dTDP-glucose 4,6-dehydratase [Ignavibacteriota bacterium]MCW5884612.1 dTDP-glucose 4,6-dehydratase [Candidatus Kapabacteria bacterium]
MKLLTTGTAGFIGSEFVRQAVSKGYDVIVVDSITYAGDTDRLKEIESNYKFFQQDISDFSAMDKIFYAEKPDAVVHWAAETHVDRSIIDSSPFMKTNVIGTHSLLECAKKYGIEKFINIATDEVYGELGETGSFYEDTPLEPNSPYSVSKTSADMLGRAYYRTFGTPVITARPSNNYGPWQFPEKLVPVVILKALHNEKIPVYGKGLNIREWLYVSDCAQAAITLLEKAEPGSIYNIGSRQERRNIEVVSKILSLLGKSDDMIEYVQDRPGHDFRYSLNYDKITNELGWTPKFDFETGMKLTVEWYLENISWAEKKLDYLRTYWKSVYKK